LNLIALKDKIMYSKNIVGLGGVKSKKRKLTKSKKPKIDIRGADVLYVEIGDYVYYIDDSTNEQIMEKWKISKK
jgi:hypothetical protein